MANPQPDRFTKISNELFAAIMTTDFSKRQRNILDLVMRMSYGCGKTTADIKRSEFELVGVRKGHVKQELKYLVQSKVISVSKEQIQINKNYDQWRISLVTCFDPDKFGQLIKRNLDNKKVTKTVTTKKNEVTETVTSENEELPKQEPSSYQNSNTPVTETVTDTPSNLNGGNGYSDLKESIKKSKDSSNRETTANSDDWLQDETPPEQQDSVSKIVDHAMTKMGVISLSNSDLNIIDQWVTGIRFETIIQGIDQAFERFKERNHATPWKKISSLSYCNGSILDLHHAKENPQQSEGQQNNNVHPIRKMSYWEQQQRRVDDLNHKRTAAVDHEIAMQDFIDAGFNPMQHGELLQQWLANGATKGDLQRMKENANYA